MTTYADYVYTAKEIAEGLHKRFNETDEKIKKDNLLRYLDFNISSLRKAANDNTPAKVLSIKRGCRNMYRISEMDCESYQDLINSLNVIYDVCKAVFNNHDDAA